MVALEHLHADALLNVLAGALLALLGLRLSFVFCHRALAARDRSIITSVTGAPHRAGRSPSR